MEIDTVKPTLTLLATLLAMPLAEAADAAALRRCRAMADDKARLACFDALVPPAASASAPSRGVSMPAPEPEGMPMPSPAAPPPAVTAPSSFGLEKPAVQPESISSSLPGLFTGWELRQRLRLANGQVWQVEEGNSGAYYLRDPKVRVRRTAFGGYMMEVEGVTPLIRVRRVE
jgi:hypothetical protein